MIRDDQVVASSDRLSVTVLMSVYNGERFLAEAVESILLQTYADFEFLILNDGSTDSSREILSSYTDSRIRIVDNPRNVGLTRSLNRGLALANSPLIARQDADDISHPRRLEKQVAFLQEHREVALVGTRHRMIGANGRVLRDIGIESTTSWLGIQWQIMLANPFVHTSVMFRRDVVWEELCGYDETIPKRQDYELWSRLVTSHRAANLQETLVDRRSHIAAISAQYNQEDEKIFEVVVGRNIARVLNDEGFPEDYPKYIVWKNSLCALDSAGPPVRLVHVLDSLWTRFCEINPEARHNPDVKKALAFELRRVAIRLASHDRLAALRCFAWTWQVNSSIALAGAFRLVSFLLFGQERMRALRKWLSPLR